MLHALFTARGRRAVVPLLPMILAAVALWPVARPVDGVGDAFMFWFAGHQVATGRSPYDQPAWVAAGSTYGTPATNVALNCADPAAATCAWVYPPAAGWLFAPFGAADMTSGVTGVDTFVVLTALAGVVASVLVFGPTATGARAVVLVTAVASHPFLYDVHVGHFAGLELLGVVGVTQGLRGRSTWAFAFGALALSLKPHLFLILVPVVFSVLVARRRWKPIAAAGAALLVLVVLGALLQPEALPAMLGRAGAKTDLSWSTPWALAQALAPAAPFAAFGALAALSAIALAYVLRSAPPADRDLGLVAASTALSLVVAPYAQPYDLLLLVPVIALAARGAARASRPARSAVLTAVPLLFVAGTWLPIVATRIWDDANRSLALVPVLALVLAAAAGVIAQPDEWRGASAIGGSAAGQKPAGAGVRRL